MSDNPASSGRHISLKGKALNLLPGVDMRMIRLRDVHITVGYPLLYGELENSRPEKTPIEVNISGTPKCEHVAQSEKAGCDSGWCYGMTSKKELRLIPPSYRKACQKFDAERKIKREAERNYGGVGYELTPEWQEDERQREAARKAAEQESRVQAEGSKAPEETRVSSESEDLDLGSVVNPHEFL
ncbi:hypothetical protein K505DRAFT_366623 [Melanomma pulvis-pyrius CBS 109.77]|uniref:Uncharacterized protein n=1 Tax=Melanomma pulvis-pyrius CBS 109.77 TaxID=1314802 RepID=A0A6A6WWI1_9PLEO|nr:hypothetical protein K505DRAFT_366623 [Melanomma pulvis-pyrius CBS 109.77]